MNIPLSAIPASYFKEHQSIRNLDGSMTGQIIKIINHGKYGCELKVEWNYGSRRSVWPRRAHDFFLEGEHVIPGMLSDAEKAYKAFLVAELSKVIDDDDEIFFPQGFDSLEATEAALMMLLQPETQHIHTAARMIFCHSAHALIQLYQKERI